MNLGGSKVFHPFLVFVQELCANRLGDILYSLFEVFHGERDFDLRLATGDFFDVGVFEEEFSEWH